MNFSELFKQTGQLCRFSPDGKYLANCFKYRLIIRDVKTLQIVHLFACLDTIQYIEWSADSQFILCGMLKRALVQVWSIEQPEWTCKIDEGPAGLTAVRWSPDGRHILSTVEFQLRITVWSLLDKSVKYIKYPKHANEGLDFSSDGQFLAVAERHNFKDYVSLFACDGWRWLNHFEVETKDLADLKWSPDGKALCVWDCVRYYKVLLYSLDGRCLATYSAYDYALGIKSVAWSPSSQFLAIGSYDEKCRVLNHMIWKVVREYPHPHNLDSTKAIAYKEVEIKPPLLRGEAAPPVGAFSTQSRYEVVETPTLIPSIKPDVEKPNPKLGISTVVFSPDNRYLYTKNDNMPTTLWIWDMQKLQLTSVLIQTAPIKVVSWDPLQARLAMCCGNNRLYLWSPAGCVSVEVPAQDPFQVNSLFWHADGQAIVLVGKEHMCVCYLTEPES